MKIKSFLLASALMLSIVMPKAEANARYEQTNSQTYLPPIIWLLLSAQIIDPTVFPYLVFNPELPEGIDSLEDREQDVRQQQIKLNREIKRLNKRPKNQNFQSGRYHGR